MSRTTLDGRADNVSARAKLRCRTTGGTPTGLKLCRPLTTERSARPVETLLARSGPTASGPQRGSIEARIRIRSRSLRRAMRLVRKVGTRLERTHELHRFGRSGPFVFADLDKLLVSPSGSACGHPRARRSLWLIRYPRPCRRRWKNPRWLTGWLQREPRQSLLKKHSSNHCARISSRRSTDGRRSSRKLVCPPISGVSSRKAAWDGVISSKRLDRQRTESGPSATWAVTSLVLCRVYIAESLRPANPRSVIILGSS